MGSMVGSWNMLVYGTAMFAMEKISGDQKINQSKIAFFFYFLGLTNLMFNWGHHTYIVPASPIVKLIAYSISMTELLILANIIYSFRKTYLKANHQNHKLSFKILTYAEIWILLNLVLSISISIPAINFYTHGTHITVAHANGFYNWHQYFTVISFNHFNCRRCCAAFFKLEKIQLESFSLQFIIGYILGLFSRNGTTKNF